MKIKVLTIDYEEKTIMGNKNTLKQIKFELTGYKPYVQEYKTIEGETIIDLDIIRLI